jgi:phosphate transport system substrate-binding protein
MTNPTESGVNSKTGRFRMKRVGCILFMLAAIPLHPQTAQDFSQVKKLYVAALSGGNGASELRDSLVRQLRKSGKFQLVEVPNQADAIVRGNGQLWIKGYVATNPRSSVRNRQAVYGGFLSIEVTGGNNEVLWSYLVTPSKVTWKSISEDLSGSLVKEMTAAHDKKRQSEVTPSGNQNVSQTALHGAGATFPAPVYQKWFESFEQRHPNVHISYDAVGSETGTQLLAEDKVDFAASDVPLPDAGTFQPEGSFLRIATVLGGVVPIYNLKDVGYDLYFTPDVLAAIYLGKIRKWNDPALKGSNKGVALPDADIVVVHRSDGSGTTYAWSDYLSKISADWKATVGTGTTLNWPAGVGAEHNEGVATMVQRTPNSIGYVELVYAVQHQLSFGTVRNAAGEYVRADLSSLNAAAATSTGGNSSSPSSITNAPGKKAYPIATFTFLLAPQQMKDAEKKAALTELLQWVLTSGQTQCSALGYAPLPREIVDRQLLALSSFK